MEKSKKFFKEADKNTLALFGIAIMIFAIMGIFAPKSFLGIANLQGMCIQFPEYGILALGMMLAMISGGIDLSLVGIANFSSIVGSIVMIKTGGSGISILFGIATALTVGALCGLFNGFLIGYLRIPAMLVTLCGLQLYTGLGLAVTKGPALTGLPESYSLLANGAFFGVPIALIIFLVVVGCVSYILKATVYGQQVLYMGTNDVASRYSGINNLKVTMKTYLTGGILGAISGVLLIMKVQLENIYNSAKADYGSSYTLLTLLIAVLGGTDPDGGKGRVAGVAMAVVVLQLVSSAFNIMRVNAFVKTFVWGLLLLVIMIITKLVENRRKEA